MPDPGGDTTVKDVELFTTSAEPTLPPNVTDVAPENPDPVMVTTVPPTDGPDDGDTPDTTGTAGVAVYVNCADGDTADRPPGVDTRTLTVPEPGGATTVKDVDEFTTNAEPATPPKVTDVAPEKPDPDTVTAVPPTDGPDDGDTPDTTGTTATVV